MKVRFTAEMIDDNGNIIGNRVSEAGGIPCPEDFDLSTKEGFLRDFDKLEKAVLKARNEIGKDLEIETNPLDCVYISIDDVGVKHQKSSRKQEKTKDSKYIENTVAHIQYGENSYALTAIGMRETIKLVLSFLLFNNLLDKELIFLTDGAKNIKSHIESVFSFHPYIVILDWFHLKKKCQELLSMSIKGKENKNKVLEKLLRILWVGDVDGAIKYLQNLSSTIIKNG